MSRYIFVDRNNMHLEGIPINQKNLLPTFKSMKYKTFRTIFRKVKIGKDGINLEGKFDDISVDIDNLDKYREMFNFQNELPLSYLYIIAQRAQIALMIRPEFTIPVPGMIHLSNVMKLNKQPQKDLPITIEIWINVDYKDDGSLYPSSLVTLYQNNEKIATNESGYLVKRKRKNKDPNYKRPKFESKIPKFDVIDQIINWDLVKLDAKIYAKVSGDANPIHTSKLFAKLAGFERQIIHGWYSASRLVSDVEKITDKSITGIEVNFEKPIYLPGSVQIDVAQNDPGSNSIPFIVKNHKHQLTHLYGKLSIDKI